MLIAFLITVVVLAMSLLIISRIPALGIEVDSPVKALIAGLIIGIFDGIWHLIPGILRTTSAILTLGIVPLLVSVIIFGLSAWLVQGFRLRYGIWSAILGAFSLTVVNGILNMILRAVMPPPPPPPVL